MLTEVNSDVVHKPKPLGKRRAVRLKDSLVYKVVMGGGSYRGQSTFIRRYTTGEFMRTNPTIGGKFPVPPHSYHRRLLPYVSILIHRAVMNCCLFLIN